MPLLRLTLPDHTCALAAQAALPQGLTWLMRDILGKQADLTVVQTEGRPVASWACNGRPLSGLQWCASLEAFVTEGTNTADDVAAFIQAAHRLICQAWAQPPSAPLYIIVHPVHATTWGYDGQTQAARRSALA
jgi:4-oxalocrotonate tautomerase